MVARNQTVRAEVHVRLIINEKICVILFCTKEEDFGTGRKKAQGESFQN
jgi:hypothetical protein